MKIKEYLQQYKADNKYTFGNFIHMFRVEKGYSIREFAIKLDISFVYLSDIEKGDKVFLKLNHMKCVNIILYK